MTAEFARLIEQKAVQVSGTYCGNSLAMGMARAVLTDFVTEDSQAALECMCRHMHDRCRAVNAATGIPALVDYVGNKGCITFLKKSSSSSGVTCIKNYQDYIRHVDLTVEQLFVFFFVNRGIWVQPRDEWSVSYQHSMEDADKFVSVFELFAYTIKDLYSES